jgi:3-isopropylmalate/(R)-2-methylmalate dehydratase large subunit
MGMTMIENLLACKAGVGQVKPGDIVTVEVDMCVMIDLQFATMWIPPTSGSRNSSTSAGMGSATR